MLSFLSTVAWPGPGFASMQHAKPFQTMGKAEVELCYIQAQIQNLKEAIIATRLSIKIGGKMHDNIEVRQNFISVDMFIFLQKSVFPKQCINFGEVKRRFPQL